MKKIDVVALLCEWGKWSRSRNVLGAKSSMLVVMQLVQPASLNSSPDIGDDDALSVDRAMAQLKRSNGEMFLVLELYFVKGLSMRQIEMQTKLSRMNAAKIFAHACGYVEAALIYFAEAA